MTSDSTRSGFWAGVRHVAQHVAISLLALAVAFSLPRLAGYVLFSWWPRILGDVHELLYVEVGLASALVVVVNLVKLAWDYRNRAQMSEIASLVYARDPAGWLSRWSGDARVRKLPWKRDLTILAVSGYRTFATPDSALQSMIADCYELRVMLLHPYSRSANAYAAGHPDAPAKLEELRREVAASLDKLREWRSQGKNVLVKFYDDLPFWKLVFAGEHVWVRCCHESRCDGKAPEYVFALQRDNPGRGFFSAFYGHFLSRWLDHSHPEYLFDRNELVFRDESGAEVRRERYPAGAAA